MIDLRVQALMATLVRVGWPEEEALSHALDCLPWQPTEEEVPLGVQPEEWFHYDPTVNIRGGKEVQS